jgi:hypothetical protein
VKALAVKDIERRYPGAALKAPEEKELDGFWRKIGGDLSLSHYTGWRFVNCEGGYDLLG